MICENCGKDRELYYVCEDAPHAVVKKICMSCAMEWVNQNEYDELCKQFRREIVNNMAQAYVKRRFFKAV